MTNQQTLSNQLLSSQNLVNLKEASTPLQKPQILLILSSTTKQFHKTQIPTNLNHDTP